MPLTLPVCLAESIVFGTGFTVPEMGFRANQFVKDDGSSFQKMNKLFRDSPRMNGCFKLTAMSLSLPQVEAN